MHNMRAVPPAADANAERSENVREVERVHKRRGKRNDRKRIVSAGNELYSEVCQLESQFIRKPELVFKRRLRRACAEKIERRAERVSAGDIRRSGFDRANAVFLI